MSLYDHDYCSSGMANCILMFVLEIKKEKKNGGKIKKDLLKPFGFLQISQVDDVAESLDSRGLADPPISILFNHLSRNLKLTTHNGFKIFQE